MQVDADVGRCPLDDLSDTIERLLKSKWQAVCSVISSARLLDDTLLVDGHINWLPVHVAEWPVDVRYLHYKSTGALIMQRQQ